MSQGQNLFEGEYIATSGDPYCRASGLCVEFGHGIPGPPKFPK